MATPTPCRAGTPTRRVEANSRLTGLAGGALFLLLALEGATVIGVRRLLAAHLFIGLLLVPPVLLKMATTGYRFVRCYAGDFDYRAAGPPALLLRLVAPAVVVSTVVVFASGIELWLFGYKFGDQWLGLHKLSFVVWFFATAVHVLGHLKRAPRLIQADFVGTLPGAITRRSLLGASLVLGLVLAFTTILWPVPSVALGER